MFTLRITAPTIPEAVIVLFCSPVLVMAYTQVPSGRVSVEVPAFKSEFFTPRNDSSAQAFARALAFADWLRAKPVRDEPSPSSSKDKAIDKPTALATKTLTRVINPFLWEVLLSAAC